MKFKRIISALTAAMVLTCTYYPTVFPASYDTAYAESEGQTISVDGEEYHKKGTTDDGFSYDLWIDQSNQNIESCGSMTIGNDGSLGIEWDSTSNATWFEADYGYNYGSSKKAMSLGEISIDYKAEHSSGESGNSRLGVHGWLTDPLVEFYIIDDWINWRPRDDNYCTTVVIDGGEYDVFKLVHYSGGLWASSEVFTQYFSVRKEPRTSGTITVSDHFKVWENLGWKMGNLNGVYFNVAGWESEGKSDISELRFNAVRPVTTTTTTETTTSTTTSTTTTQETETTTSQETSVTTSVTVSTDDKTYVEVRNNGSGEIIPPYYYYSNTENGHMYAAEGGCFKAESNMSVFSNFSAVIKKSEENMHIIGKNNHVTADYKVNNTYKDNYQISYELSGKNDYKYTDIIVVENSRNYPIQYNLRDYRSSHRIPVNFDIDLVKTYTANGHEYDLYKDEYEVGGNWITNTYETYIAVRKDQEEGENLEGFIDFTEHLKQMDESLLNNLSAESVRCGLSAEMSEGTLNVLKNDIVFETDDYPYFIIGDLNFDKTIDSLDLAKAKADLISDSDDDISLELVDLNKDNEFTLADVVLLKLFVLGKVQSFDID